MPHNDPFVMFCEAEISYEGRASSMLGRGNYLIVGKTDGSLLVHAATLTQPRNYMGPGSTVFVDHDQITAKRKGETLCISIFKVHDWFAPDGWSDLKIELSRTERELTDKIAERPERYIHGIRDCNIYREFSTSAGPVDLVVVATDDTGRLMSFIIEVKRKKVTLNGCYQLKRYLDAYIGPGIKRGCLAGPEISDGASKHCKDHGYLYIPVFFTEDSREHDEPET